MEEIRITHALLVVIFLLLSAGLSLITWKMFQFRNRLYAFIDNDLWQQTLFENNIYNKISIVFFGDSQIYSWLMAPSFGSLPIINRGIYGDWAFKAIDRFEKDVINLKPKILVMLIGTNDLGSGQPIDRIINNIDKMLRKATDQNIQIILCNLLPVRNKYIVTRPLKDILLINNKLEILSRQYDSDYVDFYSQLTDKDGLFSVDFTSDGIHPNRSGYLRMSKIIFPYLIKNIARFTD
jgi:lysophospholipase L1-like esterase